MMSYAENIFCIPENYFIVREYGMDKKWSDIVEKLDYAFQPIVNIHNGNCLGYEVLLRNYQKAGFKEINDIFDEAYNELVLFSLEIALREKAIKKFSNIGGHQKLKMFFNIDNRIITMPDYLPGATAQILKEVGLFLSSVCFEISERHQFENYNHAKNILYAYKKQLYRIAIDDFGSGYSGLQLLYHAEPDFIKIDRFFIEGIEEDSKKKLFVAKVINLAKILGIITIAEGVETEKEFFFCKEIGCDFAQGYFIQKPTTNIEELQSKYEHIAELNNRNRRQKINDNILIKDQMEYLEPVCIRDTTTGQLTDMYKIFEKFRTLKNNTFFPAVNEHNEPLGLIKEKDLKEYVYSKYGKDLLMNRATNKTIMDFITKCPVAEISTKIETILEYYSMEESSECILLTENGIYVGFLSAHSILMVLNEKNLAIARDQNPLTKLPGNTLINEFIEHALTDMEKEYIIVYFDFNYFKSFNDKYGFRRGDRVITLFSDILKKTSTSNRFFVGHIGGDDFFAGFKDTNKVNAHNIFKFIEQIILKFKQDVVALYDAEDREKGYIVSTDRDGNIKPFPLMTVSAAIISIPAKKININSEDLGFAIAYLKKQAKNSDSGISFMVLDNKQIETIKCENNHKDLGLCLPVNNGLFH